MEITNVDSVAQVLETAAADVIVNTAAMHHVETCEREPEKAFAVNAMGPRNLALVARELDAVLMHVSTDYVFDGQQGDSLPGDRCCPAAECLRNHETGRRAFCAAARRRSISWSAHLACTAKHPCRGKGGLNFVELMLKLARERGEVRVVDRRVGQSHFDGGAGAANRCLEPFKVLRTVPRHSGGQLLLA